ncbi:MAG: proton-conducting transporter membrane subunit [Candidatus Saganbacteria bacterium]|nr:proton-conducting transporter membrane subunit [Candidatus Saganbacteria bacterium]
MILLIPIFLPVIIGIACIFLKNRIKEVTLTTSLLTFLFSFIIYITGDQWFYLPLYNGIAFSLRAYPFSSTLLMAASFLTILILWYSTKFMQGKPGLNVYFANMLITLGAASGVLLANDLVILLLFWGILGIPLYLLIGLSGPKASDAAKKTFIIVGGSDALMILGAAIVFSIANNFDMSLIRIPVSEGIPLLAYLCLAAGAFAKAGAMPLHTWIPDIAEVAEVPVLAMLPAAIDKILGIYLLARLSLDLFIVKPGGTVSLILLIIGSMTIVAGVMMALVQHTFRKLLSYHAVSQVGYMVLGIGTANPIGIAGGLFHMLNNAIYKCLLFLGAGAVEKETGEGDLEKLGGLANLMPVTFATLLIAALSISGIPPLNGFFSKWMIYQGIIELGKSGGKLWILWLAAAMFGSALTLASFMKLIHSVFLSEPAGVIKAREVSPAMRRPMIILASLCLLFGIFAFTIPIKLFILPAVPNLYYIGLWQPVMATLLLLIGLAIGASFYFIGAAFKPRRMPIFYGGEKIKEDEMKISGINFYDTIKNLDIIKEIYEEAEAKFYDIYELLKKFTFSIGGALSWLHNGLLHTYVAWILLGLLFVLYRVVR